MHEQAGALTVFIALPPKNGPPLAILADPPHSPWDYDLTRGCGIIGKKPMTKLGIYHKRGEQGVSPGDLAQLTCDDLLLPAKVIRAAGRASRPAKTPRQGYRQRRTNSQVCSAFPGKFSWEKYTAARHRTSFSCLNWRIRQRASHSSVASRGYGLAGCRCRCLLCGSTCAPSSHESRSPSRSAR